eukprot:PLAT7449.1.p1 GENE.PLAT7449.1~~PLAT7449.1.p1  ORF type:complete len:353 (+),score=142.65 PLAT7449.1:133-1059(+)
MAKEEDGDEKVGEESGAADALASIVHRAGDAHEGHASASGAGGDGGDDGDSAADGAGSSGGGGSGAASGSGSGAAGDRRVSERRRKQPGFWTWLCCCCCSSGGVEEDQFYSPRRPLSVLPPLEKVGRKTLVLDLDETLVHSSFRPISSPDYIIPVEIDGTVHQVFVCKRPGVDLFMQKMGAVFEIVVYTASLSKYADPLLDKLDVHGVIDHRLFREACTYYEGNYVKDLSQLGRSLAETIIVDNSPASYLFQPKNAIPVENFVDDMGDRELFALLPFLESLAAVDDVCKHTWRWRNARRKAGIGVGLG